MNLPTRCPDHTRRHQAGCPTCRQYAAAWARRRNRLIAYGQWRGPQDAAPVRAHLLTLTKRHGMSVRAIAEQTGIARSSVAALLGDTPPATVRVRTADALLACRPTRRPALVDAVGTARRLQALTALGHPIAALAAELGRHPSFVAKLRRMAAPQIRADVAKSVDDLYVRLEGTAGPCDRTRALAREFGWAPPLAWDDRIDDPAAVPDEVAGDAVARAVAGELPAVALTYAERLEAVRKLLRRRWSDQQIAERLQWRGGRHAFAQYRTGHGLLPAQVRGEVVSRRRASTRSGSRFARLAVAA